MYLPEIVVPPSVKWRHPEVQKGAKISWQGVLCDFSVPPNSSTKFHGRLTEQTQLALPQALTASDSILIIGKCP